MARPKKKVYMVYVNEKVRNDPELLFNAAYDHLVKKGMDIGERKRFMTRFLRAPNTKSKFAVIEQWVQVRDIDSFPFPNKPEQVTNGKKPASEKPATEEGADADVDTGDEGGVPVDGESEDTGATPE